jgi:hypothetical protein
MLDFFKEATVDTPLLSVNFSEGVIVFEGVSKSPSTFKFFQPLLDTLRQHQPTQQSYHLVFRLQQFNTATARCIFLVLKEIKQWKRNGVSVKISWQADPEDGDMIEVGQNLQDLVDLPFTFSEN